MATPPAPIKLIVFARMISHRCRESAPSRPAPPLVDGILFIELDTFYSCVFCSEKLIS